MLVRLVPLANARGPMTLAQEFCVRFIDWNLSKFWLSLSRRFFICLPVDFFESGNLLKWCLKEDLNLHGLSPTGF